MSNVCETFIVTEALRAISQMQPSSDRNVERVCRLYVKVATP